jgi:His/Glu/Gln/Arg/opine family amino acid ABC transporter permease subunit
LSATSVEGAIVSKSANFDLKPVFDSFGLLMHGFGIAMYIAVVSIILAVILGVVVALMRLSTFAPARWLAFAYTQLFRGLALYVLIIWVYFGLAVALNINLAPITAGILTLALLNSGYLSETFRSGILAVDRGQVEAATAIGLSKAQIFKSVVGPQALRKIAPATGNQFVDAIKDSAILSVIGVPELMHETQRLAQYYFRPFEFYTFAGALYFVAVLGVSYLFRILERKLSNKAVEHKRIFSFQTSQKPNH